MLIKRDMIKIAIIIFLNENTVYIKKIKQYIFPTKF